MPCDAVAYQKLPMLFPAATCRVRPLANPPFWRHHPVFFFFLIRIKTPFPHRELMQLLPETSRRGQVSKMWIVSILFFFWWQGTPEADGSALRKCSRTSSTALGSVLAYCHLALLSVNRTCSYFCPLLSSTLCLGEQMKCLHIHRLRRHKFSWVLL